MPTKVIVTTDPGQDEAAAIMMMLAAPESFEILGFVATAGNIGLDHTVLNTLKILELAGPRGYPRLRGMSTADFERAGDCRPCSRAYRPGWP